MSTTGAASWDKEYAGGRYRHEPPVAFVADILGPKAGLEIHFFGEAELRGLFATGFEPVMPLRPQITRRQPPETGQWTQWEDIWRASE